MLTYLLISFRYLTRYFRRYIFLFIALSFGFSLVTLLTGIKTGMDDNVYRSAQSHYAGDIVISGYDHETDLKFRINETEKISSLVKESNLPVQLLVNRTLCNTGTLFFNGNEVRQKYVLGVEWDNEFEYFQSLEFSSGRVSPQDMAGKILLSSPVAKELSVKEGDSILLELNTRSGQKNTSKFVVAGIVEDRTIFGYFKCFISKRELNDLLQIKEDESSSIGIYLKKSTNVTDIAEELHSLLSEKIDTAGLPYDRDDLAVEAKKNWPGIRHFIITIPVYLSEVSEILMAIQIISYFLYFLILCIIAVSVQVTYRLILNEREKELGTMRAVGFQPNSIFLILLFEVVFLILLSFVVGYLLAVCYSWVLSQISFNWIPSFEIFMKNGQLESIFTWGSFFLNGFVLFIILIPSLLLPIYKTIRLPLREILSGGNK